MHVIIDIHWWILKISLYFIEFTTQKQARILHVFYRPLSDVISTKKTTVLEPKQSTLPMLIMMEIGDSGWNLLRQVQPDGKPKNTK